MGKYTKIPNKYNLQQILQPALILEQPDTAIASNKAIVVVFCCHGWIWRKAPVFLNVITIVSGVRLVGFPWHKGQGLNPRP